MLNFSIVSFETINLKGFWSLFGREKNEKKLYLCKLEYTLFIYAILKQGHLEC